MKKKILILTMIAICICLSGCDESKLSVNGNKIHTGESSGDSSFENIKNVEDKKDTSSGKMPANSGETYDVSLQGPEVQEVSVQKVESYYYDEGDEFAKLNGSGIEKYQISGLKDKKKEKLINDKFKNLYEETVNEYKKNNSTEYLPSLNGFIILEDEQLLSFGISRKWLATNETYVNEYCTINKNTAELMELSDFYEGKVGFLKEISKQIYDEFEARKEQLKLDYEIDDSYFFNLTQQDFYDKILLNQASFYISENGELVYYFQKYEIGPGTIGDQKFVLIENVEV